MNLGNGSAIMRTINTGFGLGRYPNILNGSQTYSPLNATSFTQMLLSYLKLH